MPHAEKASTTSEFHRGERSFSVPAPLLQRLAESTGSATWDTSLEPASRVERDRTWQEAIADECAIHGMSARPVVWSVGDAIGAAQPSIPLVSMRRTTQGQPDWFAVLEGRRGRVLVSHADGSSDWMKRDAFVSWVSEDSIDAPRSWAIVENRFPSAIPTKVRKEDARHREPSRPFQKLMDLLRPDYADLWAFLLFAALIGGLTLATPIAVQQLVNSIAFGGLIQPVVILALLLFGVLGFAAVLSGVQAVVAELIQRRVFVRVVVDVAERLPRVRPEAFDKTHGPELVNRVFDTVTVQKAGSLLLIEGTSLLLQTVVGLTVLSFYHPMMLAFSGLLVVGIVAVVVAMGRGAIQTAIAESGTKYEVVHWLEELARHPATFREAASRHYASRRTNRLALNYVAARKRHYRIVLRQFSGALTLQVIASSALLALGGMLVVQGQLTLGQLVASELIITVIVAAVAKFGKQLETFYDLLAAIDKLSMLIDLPLERESGSDLRLVDGPLGVDLAGLDFSYGSRSVLQNLDLQIAPGERIAVRGAMGSGKSTLFDMLAGMREPTGGSIAFDGRDSRDIRLDSLRAATALVRDPEVFEGSILENLQVGHDTIDHAEVLAALAAVGLIEEIRQMPDGLESALSTEGRPLSQVEIVRLMLARAILRRPRLLLIDRALDHLDADARERICEVLFDPEANWTLAVITERADILAYCGRTITLGGPEIWSDPPLGTPRAAAPAAKPEPVEASE